MYKLGTISWHVVTFLSATEWLLLANYSFFVLPWDGTVLLRQGTVPMLAKLALNFYHYYCGYYHFHFLITDIRFGTRRGNGLARFTTRQTPLRKGGILGGGKWRFTKTPLTFLRHKVGGYRQG